MGKLNSKLSGFTLVETLVSLVIVISVFAIGMLIMGNIMKSDHQMEKLDAMMIINEVYCKTISEKNYVDNVVYHDSYKILIGYYPYQESNRLVVMTLEVQNDNGKSLVTRKEVLIAGK